MFSRVPRVLKRRNNARKRKEEEEEENWTVIERQRSNYEVCKYNLYFYKNIIYTLINIFYTSLEKHKFA